MARWDKVLQTQLNQPINRRAYRTVKPLQIPSPSGGLHSSVSEDEVKLTEASDLVNFNINPDGAIVPRPGIELRIDDTEDDDVVDMVYCEIDGYAVDIFALADGGLQWGSGSNMVAVTDGDDTDGPAFLLPYNGVCLVLDGGYLKYISYDSTAVNFKLFLAYDAGSGSDGKMWSQSLGIDRDEYLTIGNGSEIRGGFKFTCDTLPGDFTLPITSVIFNLRLKGDGFTGTDNVDIDLKIRKVSDDSVVAYANLVEAPIADVLNDSSYTEIEITSFNGDAYLESDTDYYVMAEYDNGDSSHNVEIQCSFVTSGGTAYTYIASYANIAYSSPVASIGPGLPPKGSFGVIHNQRPFIAGALETSGNYLVGRVYFGNLTHLDWSTSNGGGYVSAVDNSVDGYAVKGLASLQDELYIFGSDEEPYMAKLTGSTPSSYAIPQIRGGVYADQKAIALAMNDIWVANDRTLTNVRGVETYGDIRLSGVSKKVSDRFSDNASDPSDMIVEFYPDYNQVWVAIEGYHRILVLHLSRGYPTPTGDIQYPWSEFEITAINLLDSGYKWTQSSHGTNEYYVTTTADGSLSLTTQMIDTVLLDGDQMTAGSVGSLADHEWDYGDNDTLGFNTIYIRNNSGDPDTSGVDLRIPVIPTSLKYMRSDMRIGTSARRVFSTSLSDYQDNTDQDFRLSYKTPRVQPSLDRTVMDRLRVAVSAKDAVSFEVGLLLNGEEVTSDFDFAYTLEKTLNEWNTNTDLDNWTAIEFHSVQFHFKEFELTGSDVYIKGLQAFIRPTEV